MQWEQSIPNTLFFPHCPEPNLTQEDIAGMIFKSVTAALDACDASHKEEAQSSSVGEKKGL